jgi:hypothetical protein
MRTQSIEVGHVKTSRKDELIHKAVVCPNVTSTVQRNPLELSNGKAEEILRRLESMRYEVRGIKIRVTALEEAAVR